METGATRRAVLTTAVGAGLWTGIASSSASTSSARTTEAEDWETTLEIDTSLTLTDVVALEDGSLLAVGQEGLLPSESHARAVRFARDGTVEWSKRIPNDTGEHGAFNAIARTRDGGAVAVGETVRPHDDLPYTACWVVKLARDGTVVWQSALTPGGEMWFEDIVRDGDGFAAVGRRGLDAALGAMVVWLDDEGRERDRRIIEHVERDPEFRAIAANEQGYCLVGDAMELADDEPSNSMGYAIGLDRDANVRWRETYEVENLMMFVDVVSDDAGGYLFVGSHVDPESLEWKSHAVSVGGDGRQRWHETYGDAAGGGFDAVARTTDGFVAAGDGKVERGAEVSDPRLVALDSSGAVTARTGLGDPDSTRHPQAIAIPEPGRSVVVGTDRFESRSNGGFALETATPSGTADADGGLLSTPMPGPGVGAALGGLAVGAGLLAARRRSRDE